MDEFGRDMGLEELLRLSLVNKEGERFSLLPLTRGLYSVASERPSSVGTRTTARRNAYIFTILGGGR